MTLISRPALDPSPTPSPAEPSRDRHPMAGAGRLCSLPGCHRHARPHFTRCDAHTDALLIRAFGRPVEPQMELPTPRGRFSAARPVARVRRRFVEVADQA